MMETISYNQLLLRTAFCCMACDGHIDQRETELIRSLCGVWPELTGVAFEIELNALITQLNENGKSFIQRFFTQLKAASLTSEEELKVLHVALQTIQADEMIEYSEIKFFKVIRACLKVTDADILAVYPGLEDYLESDVISEVNLDRLAGKYFDSVELPQFQLIEKSLN